MEKYNVKLDFCGLRYGSILPDLCPKYTKPEHKKELASGLVECMIRELQRNNVVCSREQLHDYSISLGIIMHFISDFFCLAHNDPRFDKSIEHTKYELMMLREFKGINIEEILDEAYRDARRTKHSGDIWEYIDKNHSEYMHSNHPGMENDIRYSFKMSSFAAFVIVGRGIFRVL